MPPGERETSQPARGPSLGWILASVTFQVGCLTLVIILGALFGGRWLDRTLQTDPWFTIGLVVISLPVTLFLLYGLARLNARRINRPQVSGPGAGPDAKEERKVERNG